MPDSFGVTEVHTTDGQPTKLRALWERRGKVVEFRIMSIEDGDSWLGDPLP